MRTATLMKRAGVSRDTLRFYEREGVLTPPPRDASGYRDYPESTIAEIRFVRLGQSVGLPLSVIRRAVPFVHAPVPGCPELRAALESQLAHVEQQLGKLRAAQLRLKKWIKVNRAEAAALRGRQRRAPRATRAAAAR